MQMSEYKHFMMVFGVFLAIIDVHATLPQTGGSSSRSPVTVHFGDFLGQHDDIF